MNGKRIASLKRQAKMMDSLGYTAPEIVHIMNMMHFVRGLDDVPVHAPNLAFDTGGNIFADGHPLNHLEK